MGGMEEERVNRERERKGEEQKGREGEREREREKNEPPKSEKWLLLHMEFSQPASQLPQRLRA